MATDEPIRRRVRQRLSQQRTLVRTLLRRQLQLRGSLFARYGVCSKEGCACGRGRKHGPYYVLSTRSAGQGGFRYLEKKRLGRVRALVRRYRDFRTGLRRLRRVNEELVRLLHDYQSNLARQGERQVLVAQKSVV